MDDRWPNSSTLRPNQVLSPVGGKTSNALNQSLELDSKYGPAGTFTPSKQNSADWNFNTAHISPRNRPEQNSGVGEQNKKRGKKGKREPVSNIKDIMNIYSDVKQSKWCNDKLPQYMMGPQATAVQQAQIVRANPKETKLSTKSDAQMRSPSEIKKVELSQRRKEKNLTTM